MQTPAHLVINLLRGENVRHGDLCYPKGSWVARVYDFTDPSAAGPNIALEVHGMSPREALCELVTAVDDEPTEPVWPTIVEVEEGADDGNPNP